MKVFPNPVKEILNVEFSASIELTTTWFEIKILDILGKEMINKKLKIQPGKSEIDVNELKSGIYFLQIGNTTRKFSKE